MSNHDDLKEKITQAKCRLPLPRLMSQLGLRDRAKQSAHCPFHDDEHKSFSIFKTKDDSWCWKCHAGCGEGDEIMLLRKLKGLSTTKAMSLYLDMAGFPPPNSHKSRECPEARLSPECPVSPVSEGQAVDGELDKLLKALAAQNACTQLNTARTRRFKLLRDLKAEEKQIGCKLQVGELATAFGEWHRRSFPFLDPAKSRDHYEAKFLSEFSKVRFATGEGMLAMALENVAKLSLDQLPMIPAKPNAPDSWRRLAALHRELSRLCGTPEYFLSYRDAAKVFDGMSHQEAHDITGALVTLGVIEIVHKGQPGLNSREAAEFRYLLSLSENGPDDTEGGFEL